MRDERGERREEKRREEGERRRLDSREERGTETISKVLNDTERERERDRETERQRDRETERQKHFIHPTVFITLPSTCIGSVVPPTGKIYNYNSTSYNHLINYGN